MTIEFIIFMAVTAILAAAIIYMEIQFAKSNNSEEYPAAGVIDYLKKLGATKAAIKGDGQYGFYLNEDTY